MPLGDDQVAVAIADVTGHGIGAAMVVAGDGGATVPSLLRQNGPAEPLEISILEGMSRQSPKRHTSGNAVGAAAFTAILEIGRSGRQPGEAGEPDAVHGATGMNFCTGFSRHGKISDMRDQISTRLTTTFRDVFDDDSLVPSPAMTAKNVAEWDSLNHIRLMVSIEKGFGIAFTTAEVAGFANVGQLVNAIAAKTSAEH